MEAIPLLEETPNGNKNEPKDKLKFVYFTHLMLGCSTFLLWKVFITPYDYFTAIYSGFHFEFWFASFYWTPAIPCLILMATHGTRIPLKPRIYSSVVVFFAIMFSIPFINKYIDNRTISLWLTLSLVIVGGSFSAVFFASSFGLAAMFPPIYTQAIMTGNAIAGIVTVFIRIVTKAVFKQADGDIKNEYLSTEIYFWSSAFVVFFTLVFYVIMNQTEFAKYHIELFEKTKFLPKRASIQNVEGLETFGGKIPNRVSVKKVLSKIWRLALLVFITFVTTASLWPGLVTAMQPEGGNDLNGWFQIILITIFCVGDLIGRMLAGPITTPSKRFLWIPILLRLVFFPLIILQVTSKPLVTSNYYAYAIAFFLPLTGGYFGGLGMVYGPGEVEIEYREVAATIMTMSLNGGIFFGSNLALLLLWLITGSIWNAGG